MRSNPATTIAGLARALTANEAARKETTCMHLTISVTINWPTSLNRLTLWSKRLFAVFYTCGILGCLCLIGSIWLAVAGRWWPAAAIFTLMLVFGAVTGVLEPLIAETDARRHAAINADQADQADQI